MRHSNDFVDKSGTENVLIDHFDETHAIRVNVTTREMSRAPSTCREDEWNETKPTAAIRLRSKKLVQKAKRTDDTQTTTEYQCNVLN